MDVHRLYEVQAIESRLNALKERLAALEGLQTSVPAIDYSKEKVQCSLSADPAFAKMVDLKNDIQKSIDELALKLVLTVGEISDDLSKIQKPSHRKILYLRYINLETMAVISCEMNLEYRYAKRLHRQALDSWIAL